MKKRLFSLFLAFLLAASLLPTIPITTYASESTGNATFDNFINDYRFAAGASWASGKTPGLSSYLSWGCCSYCADFVKYCFGIDNPTSGTAFYDTSEIRAGDVIVVGSPDNGTGHWFVCLKRSGNSLYVAEGNWGSKVRIGWNYSIAGSKSFSWESRSLTAGYHFLNQQTANSVSVSDGTYILESKLDSTKVADVYSGAKTAGTNIELWKKNGKNNQKFKIKKSGNSYQILSVCSGLSLDVDGASTASGTNIKQWTVSDPGANNLAQKWAFEDAGDGYVYIRSLLGTYLDVSGGATGDGTNIWAYAFNGTNAQKWRLVPCAESCVSVSDGTYILESKIDSTKAADVYSGAKVAGTNIELWTKNGKDNQKFKIKKCGDCYQILPICSGLSLDVDGGSAASGTNIKQWTVSTLETNNLAQKWVFEDAGDGYVYIHSLLGTYLDVYSGEKKDGTNIWAYAFNASNAQKWRLIPCAESCVSVQEGIYVLESKIDSNKAADVYSGANTAGTNIELWTKNGKANQKFEVKKIGDCYQILSVCSGLSLDVDGGSAKSGTNIKQWTVSTAETNNLAQKWIFEDAGNGYVYIHSLLGTYLDVYNGEKKDGTNIWAYAFNGSDAQKWKLVSPTCSHSYSAWTTTKAATCTAAGEETRTCSLCGETESRTVDALGHNYVSGICTRCGATDPDYVEPTVPPTTGGVHFAKQATYTQGQFTDVPENQWYTENVAAAVEFGLMKGSSATTFKPYGDVTIAEAITMAARIHSIYTTGKESFVQTDKWYQCYLDYTYQNGIISTAYYNCDVTQKATRVQFAEIFAAALPEEALGQINTIADNAVPDVNTSAAYAPSVYKLYRAGILAGGDARGTFSPLTYITRAECATIVARMADSDNRVDFTLT